MRKKELGMFSLDKRKGMRKEKAKMMAGFNNTDIYFSMGKIQRGRSWLNSHTIRTIIFGRQYAEKSA